ncbi:TadE/TadG family type IV pilus assembly protein [Streptomyces boninensis]|uniref:TadE/TadG family type IV pilus assembly protein n=1 Tax=Streptomyces boninensis TaxID=2039455 RepID=UPI003B220156
MRDDRGQVTPFTVVIALAVLMFGGLALDGGLALAAKIRAIGEAQEAARAGAQALDLAAYRKDQSVRLLPAQARARAQAHLKATGDAGTVTVTGETVDVTVTTEQPTQLLQLFGIGSFTVQGEGQAHPEPGVDAAP